MGEALAEARRALERGERPNAAVAVVDEAMVVRAHDRVQETNDPTAHAVIVALRETARKLGSVRLADATIFSTQEPCAMCVGAMLESDIEALVYAVANSRDGAAGTVIQLAQHPSLPRRIKVVSGIRRDEAEALFAPLATVGGRAGRVWYPLPRRGVRVVDGAALEKRCAKAPRVRIPPSPPRSSPDAPWVRCRLRSSLTHLGVRSLRSSAPPSQGTPGGGTSLHPSAMSAYAAEGRGTIGDEPPLRRKVVAPTGASTARASRRGRLVDYGAALEMRFGATRRGFESRPLRHSPTCRARDA